MALILLVGLLVSDMYAETKGNYSEWRCDEEKMIYSCDYVYKNIDNSKSTCKVVIYYGDDLRKNWVYFFNSKNEPWTRCYIKSYSKNSKPLSHWQQLNKNKDGYNNYSEKNYTPTPSDGVYSISIITLPEKFKLSY